MNDIRYMCLCRSIFSSRKDLDKHVLYCEHPKTNSSLMNKPEILLVRTVTGVPGSNSSVELNTDFRIEIINSWALVVENNTEVETPDDKATNLWGRRLPRRTKVPFLSRAVPLSTDHSYERCQCGAVFVTRMGKRQHQARFCKFVKNKTKTNTTVKALANLTPADVQTSPVQNSNQIFNYSSELNHENQLTNNMCINDSTKMV